MNVLAKCIVCQKVQLDIIIQVIMDKYEGSNLQIGSSCILYSTGDNGRTKYEFTKKLYNILNNEHNTGQQLFYQVT